MARGRLVLLVAGGVLVTGAAGTFTARSLKLSSLREQADPARTRLWAAQDRYLEGAVKSGAAQDLLEVSRMIRDAPAFNGMRIEEPPAKAWEAVARGRVPPEVTSFEDRLEPLVRAVEAAVRTAAANARRALLHRPTYSAALADEMLIFGTEIDSLLLPPIEILEHWSTNPHHWRVLQEALESFPQAVAALEVMLEQRVTLARPVASLGEEAERVEAHRKRMTSSSNPFLSPLDLTQGLERYLRFERRLAALTVCLERLVGEEDAEGRRALERVASAPLVASRGEEGIRCQAGTEDPILIPIEERID